MATLTSIFASRSVTPFFQRSSNQMVRGLSKGFSSSRTRELNPLVGTPELPLPGTTLYSNNISRLNNPEFLKQATGQSQPSVTEEVQKILKEAMQEIRNQNTVLFNEVHMLNQKVQKLESRLEKL